MNHSIDDEDVSRNWCQLWMNSRGSVFDHRQPTSLFGLGNIWSLTCASSTPSLSYVWYLRRIHERKEGNSDIHDLSTLSYASTERTLNGLNHIHRKAYICTCTTITTCIVRNRSIHQMSEYNEFQRHVQNICGVLEAWHHEFDSVETKQHLESKKYANSQKIS